MFYKLTLFVLLLLASISGSANHILTGEITYVPVTGQARTYDITVTLYLTNPALSDQIWLYLSLGDNSPLIKVNRSNGMGVYIPGTTINKSTYTYRYTYTKDGTYNIATAIDIRNYSRTTGIINMPNSGATQMYVSSLLTISPALAPISSPYCSFPPIENGCTNILYKINPGGIDPDQDILRYQLLRCQTANDLNNPVGTFIPGYKFPDELDLSGRTLFTMDSLTGLITWDKPTNPGSYSIAFIIKKYRNGVLIGSVIRDMLVIIAPCANNPPVINKVPNLCVQTGNPISYLITSKDPDNDTLTFTTSGIPYGVTYSPATYTPQVTNIGSTSGNFNWNTNLLNFTKNPYQVYYKVSDTHYGSSLTDVTSNFITLVAPPVKNVNATVFQNGFNVKWDQTVCTQATGYNIYRKIGTSNIVFDSCTMGVSLSSGFSLITTINNQATLIYTDLNNGTGLDPGLNYCYIVTAKFADGAESAPSIPYCSKILPPVITVIQDTISNCLGTGFTVGTNIIRFDNTNQQTTYKWSSSPGLQLSNANNLNVNVKSVSPGLEFLKVVITSGAFVDSAKIYVQNFSNPVAKISLKDLGGTPNSVMFYNNSTNAVNAQWLFSDGTSSKNMDSVMFQFTTNGLFRTHLKVFNSLGCPDTISILFSNYKKGVFMPNAFEPENPNSELNSFRPAAIGLQSYFLGIWDLWGNMIWSSEKLIDTHPAEGWNGSDRKDNKLPSQHYIWRMKATFIDGSVWEGLKDHSGKYHKEGTIFLLR